MVERSKLVAGAMPAGAIKDEHNTRVRVNLRADLFPVQIHRLGVGFRQHQGGASVARRTDGPENVGPFAALIAQRRRSAAASGPDVGQRTLLTNPGFGLPPELDRLAARV